MVGAGPWMRECISAVKASWDCWQNGTRLDFQGEHYRLNLTVPLFNPGPVAHPAIPIHLAAVNPYMCQVAGEAADGIRSHPVCIPRYIAEVMWLAARRGAAKTGRNIDGFAMSAMPLIATAADAATLEGRARDVRARVAFYASTPA
ncbi:MAG TPA: LLM class flavin-dependent oxidoreductase [Stellaceae bacterium]|jgi:alkanesulfonate monooxygenase SsuD/methylene tetrahydromethanopterin reductase-like flavin-dependent oxidoreductase (luciferase family)